jgi:hypothetical protein
MQKIKDNQEIVKMNKQEQTKEPKALKEKEKLFKMIVKESSKVNIPSTGKLFRGK